MSVVTLIELSPRRPSDGVVQPLRFVHNARVTGRFLGQQWRPLVASLPESEADLGFDGLMFAQGGYPQVGRLVVAVGTSETWPALMWNGAAVALRVAAWPHGNRDPADGDFGPAMPARVESLSVENGVATFTLIDSAQHLRRPVTSRRFGSTGIALLDSADVIDHKGAVVPTGWGRLLNVPGILVDRANNIWLFLDRPAASAQGFYDGGKAFAPGVARADLAALRANSPAAGSIDWALNAAGMVLARPWTAPTYVLTADLTTTPETIANIAQAIVSARTTLVFAAGTVAAFNALQPAPAGLYVDDERSIGDALNSLLAGVGGWWRLDSAGDIALGRFGITAPARTFAAHEFISARREEIIAPTRRRSVGWGRNNRVHSEGEIATILLIDDIDGLGDLATQDQVDWSQVAGAGKPADGATRNAFRGVHNPANAYQMGDEVSNAGNDELWVAITDVPPGITLGNPSYWSLKLVSGGGAPGMNNATIFLYQRTGTDVPPAVPGGTLTYTFATNALSGPLGAWARSMPLTGGAYRWMITAQANSSAPTDDIAPGEWPSPALLADAMPNVDRAFLYARAATAPALPAGTLTFTFATRVLSGALGAWTQNIPDTNGQPLWVTAASAVSVGATAAIAPGQWSAAVRQAVDGAPGASSFHLIQSASNRYDLTMPGKPIKTGITTWEDMFRTPTPYAGGVRVEWIITDTNKPHMVGFDADASLAELPSPYQRFDWALYPTNAPAPGALYRYKAGGALPLLPGGALQAGDHMALVYDGRQVTAWHNGVLLLTDAAVPQMAAMFVVGSIRDPGEALHDLAIAAGGVDGIDGIDGDDGKWIEFVFRRAPTQPATPTGNGIPAGWTDDPQPGANPLWMSKAKQELDGTLVTGETWSTPVRHDGPPGADGADGVDGIDGDDGDDGISAVQPAPFVVRTASNGTPLAGALPQTRQLRILQGVVDVTGSYSWSVNGAPIDCILSVNGAGLVTLSGISADSASGEIKAARAGFPDMFFGISATRSPMGAAGISVSTAFLAPGGTSYVPVAGPTDGLPIPVDRGVRAAASASFQVSGSAATIDGYAQYSLDDGVSWTTFGPAFSGTGLPMEPAALYFIGTLSATGSARVARFRLMARINFPAALTNWNAQPLSVEVV